MAGNENVLGLMSMECKDGFNTEDYNQIEPGILDCFPPTKYPVNLFHWREDIAALSPVYVAGREVDRRLRAKFRELSEKGVLFFSRNQIDEYTACMAANLRTALDDPNLTWDEQSVLFINELACRQEALYRNPMGQELENLQRLLETLCVYLVEDPRRMATLACGVHNDVTPMRRRVNASLIAIAIYIEMNKGKLFTETLETVSLGFFLYDIGMTKLSPMMLAKCQQLTPPEQRIVREHPKTGLDILARLNLTRPEVTEPCIQHHERINGSGYPNKLMNEKIGKLGRIAAVADSYCAMISDTAHRKGLAPIKAAAELVTNDRHYDQIVCRHLVRFLQTVSR